MPVLGYFSKRDDRKLTMPPADEGVPDASGFAFRGDILTGKRSVQEASAHEAARRSQTMPRGVRVAAEDYDPVLKFHLGIK